MGWLDPTLYRLATRAATPAVRLWLRRRMAGGKEDPARLGERLGRADRPRPDGPLAWVNAVSVGEALSALPLIDRMLADRPRLEVLVTTGTVTAAAVLGERLPARCRHQYAPVDLPGAVGAFLDHWRPDLGVFVESELWPNLILEARRRGVPLALINGRMTEPTWRKWRGRRALIAPVLSAFEVVLARTETDRERFGDLGAAEIRCVGDLKWAARARPSDDRDRRALAAALGERPRWLAASTHDGEEAIAARVHERLADRFPGLVTVIAPRHPERGAAIAADLAARGAAVARRSAGAPVPAPDGIYVADTLGELDLFFALTPIVFMGGSLVSTGGHNLLEPARHGAAILHGPHMDNFADTARVFQHAGAAVEIFDPNGLSISVGEWLADPALTTAVGERARALAAGKADVLDAVADALAPLLDRIAPVAA